MPRLLRLACLRYHDTYANLCHDGQVAVALLAPPDIAVNIAGRARVVKDRVDAIQFSVPENLADFYMTLIDEVERM